MLGEQPPRVGEPHPAPVLGEQLLPDLALQLGHLLGDGRGRDVQPLGRPADRAVPGEGVEGAQALQIQHVSNATRCRSRKSRLCYDDRRGVIVVAMSHRRPAAPSLLPRPTRTARRRPPSTGACASASSRSIWGFSFLLIKVGTEGVRTVPGHPGAAAVRHGGARGGDGGEAGAAAARGAHLGAPGGRRLPAQRAAVLALRLLRADHPLHAGGHLQRDLAAVGHGPVPGRPLRGPAHPAPCRRVSASASSAF